MVRLREIPRTAAFAWSPGTELPFIATGTKAGAVDADFSSETALELWDLQLQNHQQSLELEPVANVSTDSRFYDIAWANLKDGRGVIAGALENGSLDLWDANKLLSNESDAFMSRTSKHSGAIKSLQFNSFRTELLATAGAKGELFISDLNNVANPFRLGSSAARADDFESVDWNKKVPHILVTGSSGGFLTVWDVKAKKESLTLNNLNRKTVSAVAWDPAQATKLATAISDDSNPLILVWDLRNSNAPERTLRAHDQGILSLSWCQQDPDLLLSCGKDNRTIVWNPQTGEQYGEFPIVTNWTFQTRWHPHHPSILATASFDGKISVQTIQNTKSGPGQTPGVRSEKLDGEDFFNSTQTEALTAAFSLRKPPKWLERPVGASFGFGGKVVSFAPVDSTSRKSKVRILHFAVDGGVGTAMKAFEKTLADGDLASICQSRIAQAKTEEEKADWQVIQTLISDSPRKRLVEYLGFSDDKDEESNNISKPESPEEIKEHLSPTDRTQPSGPRNHRLSLFFDSGDSDNFLSGLSSTKGAKTNNPFQIYTGSESASDRQITRALLLGQFEKALNICLREDRMSDAFMVAICGGQKCIEKAQAAYLGKQSKGPNYLRLLASIVGKNLWDVVYNADLLNWREVMATLCTFAGEDEFPDLCEALGDRLEEELKSKGDKTEARKSASFCYLAGCKLEKVVAIWIEETQEDEATGLQEGNADSTFSLHARSLQSLIEKVTVFREVTRFEDTSYRTQSSDWKLAPLYDKYAEYADVAAAHGFLEVAEKYLDLLPAQYAAAEVARNRIKQATRKAPAQPAVKQMTSTARQTTKNLPTVPLMQQQQGPAASGVARSYTPNMAVQPSTQTAPITAASAYTPVGYQQPQQQNLGVQQPYGAYYQGQGVGPPPRNLNASPSIPPPSRATDMSNWNDTPMVTKPAIRRGTPGAGAGPITSAFPNQQQPSFPTTLPTAPYGVQQKATPPLPPPPKGPAPPPMMPSPQTGSQQFQPVQPQLERPPSATRNQYAPPLAVQSGGVIQPPTVPRGVSPYNPPPAAAPASNRYAPSAPQPDMTSELQGRPLPPPGSQGPPRSVPSNAYAPQQVPYSAPPPPQQRQPYSSTPSPQYGQAPPQAPPQDNLSGSGPGSVTSQRPTAPTSSASQSKYPPGDRSHIPDHARPIFEILNADMQRVKSKAPAAYKAQVLDTEKRLDKLFDHLNNETLLKPDTVESMVELAQAMRMRDYDTAQSIQVDLYTNKLDECGQWMVGVKRLIGMSRATP